MTHLLLLFLLAAPLPAPTAAGEAFVTYAGFTLGTASLADVQNRFGPSPLFHVGDAGDSEWSVCYASVPNNLTVRFLSGELGGPEHTLLGFQLLSVASKGGATCPPSTAPPQLAFPRDLAGAALGMSRSSFAALLNTPLPAGAGPISQSFCGTRLINGTTFDRCIFVTGQFVNGRLTGLTVTLTETN